jgi:hypothetical protein
MLQQLLLLTTFVPFLHSHVIAAAAAINWDGTITLNADFDYTLSHFTANGNVTLQLKGKTAGWLGFGLSESGSMQGTDAVTCHQNSDGVSFRVVDRFVGWVGYPMQDDPMPFPSPDEIAPGGCSNATQDWYLISGSRTGDYLTCVITRPLISYDKNDRNFTLDKPNRIVFAFGNSTVDVAYHGANRGQANLGLGSTPSTWQKPADAVKNFTLSLNWELRPKYTTQYVCKSFDVGTTTDHVVAFYPRFTSKFIHHVLVHTCGTVVGTAWNMTKDTVLPCQSTSLDDHGNSPLGNGGCTSIWYGWAPGIPPVSLPLEAGYRMGSGGSRYIILEFHIDNPTGASGSVDGSVDIFTVNGTLRKYDAGSMVVGDPTVSLDVVIGPGGRGSRVPMAKGTKRKHFETSCHSACTKYMYGPINIFSSFLHMHKFGKEIWTTQFDTDGTRLGVVTKSQYWSFANQLSDTSSFKFYPNQRFNTHCVYDTTKSTEDVYFGSSSNDEMCMTFNFYYPLQNGLAYCGTLASIASVCSNSTLEAAADFIFKDTSLYAPNPNPSDGDLEIPPDARVGQCLSQVPNTIISTVSSDGNGLMVSAILLFVVGGVGMVSV